LTESTPLWLPYELVHANYTLPFPTGSGCFLASTNGLASGNHRLEAIVHGICEVIERDSTTLWNLKDKDAKTATGLDLESVDDPGCRDTLERFTRADIDVKVWETTSDVGVASFYCLFVDRRDSQAHTADGAGCHPARDVALLRALTEAAQIRMTYITGSREDIPADEYALTAKRKKLRDCLSLVDWHAPVRDFALVPSSESEQLEDDLAGILRRLQMVGIRRVLAVDLTKLDIGLPVVRVVIPGMEGPDEHPGYVPSARARAVLEGRA
jgi:ribosomal protein S12 methylthiotransferase accessory factor